MGNCCKRTYKTIRKKQTEKTVVLLLVGLDNSGKSLVLKRIAGDRSDYVVPTVGFRITTLKYKTIKVKVYDIGGGPQIRAIWPKYYADIYGVIYVVDAGDTSRLSENKAVFSDLVTHENIAGKPILLLANKQDLNYAVDELDLVENLEVEKMVNSMKCPTRVETCSCIISEDSSDANLNGIIDGYRWLMETIVKNYTYLNSRVKLAEKLENSKRRKSSITSRLSAWSSSFPRQDLNNKQGSSTLREVHANGSDSTMNKKLFHSARNRTAPLSERLPIELTQRHSPIKNNVSPKTVRPSSQRGRFLEKPARSDLALRQSARSARRPQTAPQIIENNFFN